MVHHKADCLRLRLKQVPLVPVTAKRNYLIFRRVEDHDVTLTLIEALREFILHLLTSIDKVVGGFGGPTIDKER